MQKCAYTHIHNRLIVYHEASVSGFISTKSHEEKESKEHRANNVKCVICVRESVKETEEVGTSSCCKVVVCEQVCLGRRSTNNDCN